MKTGTPIADYYQFKTKLKGKKKNVSLNPATQVEKKVIIGAKNNKNLKQPG